MTQQQPVVSREETQAKLSRRGAAGMKVKANIGYTLADRIEQSAKEFGERICIEYQDEKYTFAEVNAISNRIAQVIKAQGVQCRDVVALCVENRPAFFFYWFAIMKVGAVASFINTNITGNLLKHALTITDCKYAVVGEECLPNFDCDDAKGVATIWLAPDAERPATDAQKALAALNLEAEAANQSKGNVPTEWRDGLLAEEPAIYIFTSGTTGLPKAAIISHARWLMTGEVMRETLGIVQDDCFYAFLPLYHGAASLSATATAYCVGAKIAVRRKFSRSNFWKDVKKHGITTMQYVGEICRYLLTADPVPEEKNHTLRKMTGTGMAAELWNAWVNRFGEAKIYESWGATEANTSLVNVDNYVGAVGRVPDWNLTNLRLLKYDTDAEDYAKTEDGKYQLAKPGEVGEAIGMIFHMPDSIAGRFEGYVDKAATEKKILRNVFQDGDQWWASGDLLREDDNGYVYFVDRMGDTFRWKSENVSTTEVADALGDFPGLESITVYGVKVEGAGGRAGMAAIVMADGTSFDPKAFYDLTAKRLPRYAAPVFIRLPDVADMTSTYKLRKVDLKKQGFDKAQVKDPLYVRDEKQGSYVELTEEALKAALGR